MAQYNADIRIGVTGKRELQTLKTELSATHTKLQQLNKALKLRAKVQTIKLNTKGAETQIKNLEQRINKLGRTITVNLRVNEKEGRKRSGGGSSVAVVSNPAKELAIAKALVPQRKALTREARQQLDLEQARATAINKLIDNKEKEAAAQKRLSTALSRQQKLEASKNNVTASNFFGAGTDRKSGLRLNNREINNARTSLRNLSALQTGFRQEVARTSTAYQKLTGDINRSAAAADKAASKAARRAKNVAGAKKGAAAGAGIAALSLPGIGDVAGGALAGAAVGGVPGALAGGLVGAGVAIATGFVAATAEVTKFNNNLKLSQKALANTVNTTDELNTALSAIEGISDDFVVPIGDATKQFTKLNAAARASGFSVVEVEEVFRGLSAANVALGGDAERLNGILLATQQVFSKGKVQAEELRGQIGERLSGSFAKFAKSAKLSTSQLDKSLELGEVSLEDFVTFAKSLLEEYEEDAKKLADAPENAAARLELAMDNLKKSLGPLLQSMGNDFIIFANNAVKGLNAVINKLMKTRMIAANVNVNDTRDRFQEENKKLADLESDMRNEKNFGMRRRLSSEIIQQSRVVGLKKQEFNAAREALNKEKDIQNPQLEPSGKPLEEKEILKPRTSGGNSKGSKGGAGSRSRLPDLVSEFQYLQKIEEIERQRTAVGERDATLREFKLRGLEIEAQLERDKRDITNSELDDAEKVQAEANAKQEALNQQLALKNNLAEFDRQELVNNQAILRDLDGAIALERAYTDEKRIQLETALAIAAVEADDSKSAQQKLKEINKLRELEDARLFNADPINAYVTQLENSLGDTRQQIADLARTVESELGSAISNSISGLIDGTQTVEEAFANMFENIGKAFINMAAQMLAQQAILSLLSMFTSSPGATGGTPILGNQLSNFGGGIPLFEGGGYTGNGARSGGLDGNGGFLALLHPNETVIDHFAAARNAMSSGGGSDADPINVMGEAPSSSNNRGTSATKAFSENRSSITTNRERTQLTETQKSIQETLLSASSGSTGRIQFETISIGGMDVVSREEAIQIGQQSADQARAKIFSDMKNRPAIRRQMGIA